MLRTALKPQWIAALVGALVVSWVFVLLSQWQFSRSVSESPPAPRTIEDVRPLTGVLRPGEVFPAPAADQMVTFHGAYDPRRQVLVRDRLQNGQKGWWVVTAFAVEGAPAVGGEHGAVIPVARGWIASPQDAAPPPPGQLTLTGRLEPSEAPQAAQDAAAGQIATLSVAQLINIWDVPSYTGFVGVTKEVTPSGAEAAAPPGLQPLSIEAQPIEQPVNWLNIFYAVEWVVFAGFSIFLWWRLVRDDYERTQDALADAEAAGAAAGDDTAPGDDTATDEKSTPGAAKAPSETGGNRD